MSHHHDLIDTTEMYLKVVFELEEEGVVPLRARIAERLQQSGPTVSQTVARMERDGLLTVQGDRHLEFTPAGREYATRVMRKHRLVERLLVDVIKLEWSLAHVEACRWEHVVSEDVERRLVDILDHPSLDPYGNPIPGLAELDRESGETPMVAGDAGLEPLDKLLADTGGSPAQVVIGRIGEPLQTTPDLMASLRSGGVIPGGTVSVSTVREKADESVRLGHQDGESAVLPAHDAAHIFARRV